MIRMVLNNYSDYSFVLVKPDAMRNEKILDNLYQLIKSNKLEVVEELPVRLSEDQINGLWPMYKSCQLTRVFIKKYLSDELCKVIVLHGTEALDKTCNIKKEIRSRFGQGFFSNCIHAPRTADENENDICLLTGEEIYKVKTSEYMEGLWGKAAELDITELEKTVDIIWERKEQYGWEAVYEMQLKDHLKSGVDLKVDNNTNHSMYYIISTLYEFLGKHISFTDIVIGVLDISRRGETTIRIANDIKETELEEKIKMMLGKGLKSERI